MRLRAPLAIVAAAMLLGSAAAADPTGRFFYVTPAAGFTLFDGSIKFPTQTLKDGPYWGGRVGYQYLPWLGVEVAGGWTSSRENTLGGQDVSFWHASGNVTLSHWGGLTGNPFISLGGGTSRLLAGDQNATLIPGGMKGDQVQGNVEAAAGWNWWFTDRMALRVEGRDIVWLSGEDITEVLTHTITSTAALTVTFGSKPRDTDVDGVPDRADHCAATPSGATVDTSGCPHDADADSVLDGLDQCPGTPKGCTIDAKGCPTDADGDGVCDGLDQCASTPKGATVDSSGCPHDADGDGVLDGIDPCADTPRGAKVDSLGCPVDSDHDGVPDGLDRCAETSPGVAVDSSGCPVGYHELEQELLDTGKIRLKNVQFETAKATLKTESLTSLDTAGDLLTKWPELRFEVAGHTDSKGQKKTNDALSQARADTVRAYLLGRFPSFKPDQLVAKGYGSSKAIAANDTEAGRALNRRVELVVLNRGALMQEVERRTKAAAPDSTKVPELPKLPEPTTPEPPKAEPAAPDTTKTPR